MTGDALKRVKAGERLVIPAAAYNEFVDAVAIVRRLENDLRSRRPAASREGIAVKNVSGMTIPPFSICYVNGHSGTVPEVDRVGATVYDNGPPLLLATGAGSIADQKIGRVFLFNKPRKITNFNDMDDVIFGDTWGILKDSFSLRHHGHGLIAASTDMGGNDRLFVGYEISSLMGVLQADLNLAGGNMAPMDVVGTDGFNPGQFSVTVHGTLVTGTLANNTVVMAQWVGRWEVVNADARET